MPEPEAPAARGIPIIEAVSERLGRAIAWLTLLMVLATAVVVAMRYFLGTGRIWLQESITWMHALVFMLGAAYALKREDHVRVDVFYRRWSARRRALVDVLGTLLLLWPTCGFIFVESLEYVQASWSVGEGSREAGGLRGLYLLKAVIPLMAVLLALQGLAELARASRVLAGRTGPAGRPER